MLPADEFMPDDVDLKREFYGSDQWTELRDSGRHWKRRALRRAISEYLVKAYPWLARSDEVEERVKYVGRIEHLVRDGWQKNSTKTIRRKKRVALRLKAQLKKRRIKKAERAHNKWRAARAPELFTELPVQHKPRKSRGK